MADPALNENFNENQIKALATIGSVLALATTTVPGVVRKAQLAAASTVPFADLTAAANYVNAMRAAFIAAAQAQ